jgi:hypothetical protein
MHYSLMRNMRLLYIDNDVLYRDDLLRQVLLYSNYYKRLCGNSSTYTKSKQFVLMKSSICSMDYCLCDNEDHTCGVLVSVLALSRR